MGLENFAKLEIKSHKALKRAKVCVLSIIAHYMHRLEMIHQPGMIE